MMTYPSMNDASKQRYRIAQTLAPSYPLVGEIAVTGSTARGFAHDQSDLEVNIWCEQIPALDERLGWLTRSGVAQPTPEPQPRPDQSLWIAGKLDGISVEIGWQTWRDLEQMVDDLLQGTITDHKTLRLADLMLTALPVTESPRLQEVQSRLRQYPPHLTPRLIESALEELKNPGTLWDGIKQLLRILFALNQRWETNWKYYDFFVHELAVRPPDLAERIHTILDKQDEVLYQKLVDDTRSLLR